MFFKSCDYAVVGGIAMKNIEYLCFRAACGVLGAVAFIATVACNMNIRGSGQRGGAHRTLESFNKIDVSGALNVEVLPGNHAGCDIVADTELLPKIETEVRGGILEIAIKSEGISTDDVVVRVYASNIDSITTHGSPRVRAMEIQSTHFKAELIGSGTITLAGQADHTDVELHGSGDIEASKLASKLAKVEINGSGDVEIGVKDSLDADVHGSGNVRYYGSPKVSVEIAGSGSVQAGG
jgi:hypothetical protein